MRIAILYSGFVLKYPLPIFNKSVFVLDRCLSDEVLFQSARCLSNLVFLLALVHKDVSHSECRVWAAELSARCRPYLILSSAFHRLLPRLACWSDADLPGHRALHTWGTSAETLTLTGLLLSGRYFSKNVWCDKQVRVAFVAFTRFNRQLLV